MPASTHTLTDGDSVCVHVLACMCKQVGGGLVFIVLLLCCHCVVTGWEGKGKLASLSGKGRG